MLEALGRLSQTRDPGGLAAQLLPQVDAAKPHQSLLCTCDAGQDACILLQRVFKGQMLRRGLLQHTTIINARLKLAST